jgi:hypothetical protein
MTEVTNFPIPQPRTGSKKASNDTAENQERQSIRLSKAISATAGAPNNFNMTMMEES